MESAHTNLSRPADPPKLIQRRKTSEKSDFKITRNNATPSRVSIRVDLVTALTNLLPKYAVRENAGFNAISVDKILTLGYC